MNNDNNRTTYVCSECNAEALRWEGRCPVCKEWNTLEENLSTIKSHLTSRSWFPSTNNSPSELSSIIIDESPRIDLRSEEFNRVMGGGIIAGSLVLLGGDPGIGKSTLLLQIANNVSKTGKSVLYVSGEESAQQIKLRATRIGIDGVGLRILSETDMHNILSHIDLIKPNLTIIDSIQSVAFSDIQSGPGNTTQVRDCALALLHKSKETDSPIIITGHVTKEGNIAGPKTLEHMVDVVLYLEGENLGSYRLLRGEKNRFGSTNEIGVFEMQDTGLIDVPNPSNISISGRTPNAVGSIIVPILEGTRPILVEIQALTTTSSLPSPRRVANGIDQSRLLMVIAVLTKRIGLSIGKQDIIMNVTGGFKATEPAADLGIALALLSSLKNTPISPKTAALGEIGLSGELRSVNHIPRRLTELSQMGFEKCLSPNIGSQRQNTSLEVIEASSLAYALDKGILSSKKPVRSRPKDAS